MNSLETKYKIIEKELDRSKTKIVVLYRYLAQPITRVLIKTSITPNQVTIFAALLGIAASALFISPNYWVRVTAVGLLQLRVVLDQVDGALARANNQCTEFGEWLDRILDRIGDVFLFFFICLGIFLSVGNPSVWIFGFLAVTGTMLNTSFIPVTKITYPKIKEEIRETVWETNILGNFLFMRLNVYFLLIFFVLAAKLYWFLIFIAGYSYLFYFFSLIYFAKRFRREGNCTGSV